MDIPLSERVTGYLAEDAIEGILKEFGNVADAEFALKLNTDPPVFIGPQMDEAGSVSRPFSIRGEEVGTVHGRSAARAPEKVEQSLELLMGHLEGRISSEMDMESLSMELANNYQEIHNVMENNNVFAEALEIDQISHITLERAIMMTNSAIATIMLYDKDKDTLKLQERSGGRPGATDAEALPLKGSIWENVVRELQPLLIEDATKPEELNPEVFKQLDFASFATTMFLSVPLKVKEEAIGVLNVGDKTAGIFTSSDVKSLSSLAAQSASSIEKARLYKNIESEARLRSNFQRYLSPSIVDDIINNRKDIALGGEVVECSILFSDICKFTTMSEKEKPETILRLLNDYFSIMTEIIFRHKGTLDKFIGDAIMALFGAPMFSPDSHRNAVRAAMEMHQALNVLKRKWEAEGLPTFQQRIGINTGMVVAGNIGSPDRMDYTVLGDVVNVASRMESNARPMMTLISEYTYEKVKDMVKVRPLEPMTVKGRMVPLNTYEILALKSDATTAEAMRAFPRFGVANAIKATQPDRPGEYQGTTLNLSIGGALLAMPVEIEAGSHLDFTLSLDGVNPVTLGGKVVYRKKLKDSVGTVYYHTGVEFGEEVKQHHEALTAFIGG